MFRTVIHRLAALASLSLVLAAAPGAPAAEVSAPIPCEPMEGGAMHVHAHLRIVDHAVPVAIPADVGRPAGRGCYFWVHTHTPDGIIHVESPVVRGFTLGDFFRVWGQPLDEHHAGPVTVREPDRIRVLVNGSPATIPLDLIPLWPHADIQILIGPPFDPQPAFTSWGEL